MIQQINISAAVNELDDCSQQRERERERESESESERGLYLWLSA